MKRREFITLLGGAAVAWPLAARAQQLPDRVRRVGLLSVGAGDTAAQPSAFRDALAKLGWVAGRNLHIELRFGGDSDADIRRYAAELVNLARDVIVTRGGSATLAMQQSLHARSGDLGWAAPTTASPAAGVRARRLSRASV
jgi:putative ABC transport system substrate-binding protein